MKPTDATDPASRTGATDVSNKAGGITTPPALGAGRLMTIAFAVAVGISLVGFLVGISEPVIPRRAVVPHRVVRIKPQSAAPAYRDLSSAVVGPNRSWASNFATLKQSRPPLFAPVIRTPAMKDAALRDRLRTRAFEGAPPVIPHAIEQQSAASCLVCHAEGMQLSGRVATKISHPHYSSCTQCHVESRRNLPWAASGLPTQEAPENISETLLPVNEFTGVLRSGPGQRAMSGTPPTIPHTTYMRGDCLSCHGLVARPGLRTTHPWLQNCVQCHAPAAELDQVLFATQREAEAAPTESSIRKAAQ